MSDKEAKKARRDEAERTGRELLMKSLASAKAQADQMKEEVSELGGFFSDILDMLVGDKPLGMLKGNRLFPVEVSVSENGGLLIRGSDDEETETDALADSPEGTATPALSSAGSAGQPSNSGGASDTKTDGKIPSHDETASSASQPDPSPEKSSAEHDPDTCEVCQLVSPIVGRCQSCSNPVLLRACIPFACSCGARGSAVHSDPFAGVRAALRANHTET